MYDLMTHDEMRFVVGHELGHALSAAMRSTGLC